MADQTILWHWLVSALDKRQPAALLLVADSSGSSPGTQGNKMAVTLQDCVGTIGGGMIEADMVKLARTMLVEGTNEPKLLRRAHHASNTIQASGMICGGEQTVLVYPCKQSDRPLFEQLQMSCELCSLSLLHISKQGLQTLPYETSVSSPAFEFEGSDDWCYREAIGSRKRAYIIGGGHVGLALSQILATLDFDITVIDERESVGTIQDNAYAKQKWSLSYTDIADHIPDGKDVFVFVMTHTHHDDQFILTELATKQLAYFGLLGSRHKIAHMKQTLAERLTNEQWKAIHAPMGLAIGSHTPEEIAISIAAEVVQVLNQNRNFSDIGRS